MKRLAGEKLPCDLTLELETVGAVFGHGLSSFESPAARSIAKLNPVRPKGPTPCPSKGFGLIAEALALAIINIKPVRNEGPVFQDAASAGLAGCVDGSGG